MGRLRPGAEISLALHVRDAVARLAARPHQRAAVRCRHRHARPHVPGRHLRSPGRRLRALRHRQRMADPALREDALRQCAAHRPADPGLAGDQEPALRHAHRRDLRLGAARDGGRRAAASPRPTTPTAKASRASSMSGTKPRSTSILGADAAFFKQAYDVTPQGNWEHHTILHRNRRAGSSWATPRSNGWRACAPG